MAAGEVTTGSSSLDNISVGNMQRAQQFAHKTDYNSSYASGSTSCCSTVPPSTAGCHYQRRPYPQKDSITLPVNDMCSFQPTAPISGASCCKNITPGVVFEAPVKVLVGWGSKKRWVDNRKQKFERQSDN